MPCQDARQLSSQPHVLPARLQSPSTHPVPTQPQSQVPLVLAQPTTAEQPAATASAGAGASSTQMQQQQLSEALRQLASPAGQHLLQELQLHSLASPTGPAGAGKW